MLNSREKLKIPLSYITTYSGKHFTIDKPQFDIVDIAAALSKQCRFTGHTKRFYSVAEHSCLVALIMKEHNLGDPYEGLMHDAHEAYCTDLASPWKVELPEYKAFEKRIEGPLRSWAGLPDAVSEGCKKADWTALLVEAHYLMSHMGSGLWHPIGTDESLQALAQKVIASLDEHCEWLGADPDDAETLFLEAYEDLS